jgi:DNA polymerase-3 subunit epsilon
MREIVLDTETTGLDPSAGHRIVELAGIELINAVATERFFHRYVNPERDMPEEAFQVHGLSIDFLSRHPPFGHIVEEFLDFVGDAPLVIHNAEFDMRFLNAELQRCGRPVLPQQQSICTLIMARQKFPGAQASLDALCRRFAIDNTQRTKHGARLDAELLAEVYLNLIGGRQRGFELGSDLGGSGSITITREFRAARPHAPSEAELTAHLAFLAKLKSPVWLSE